MGGFNTICEFYIVLAFELHSRKHVDRVPRQLPTNPGTNLAADTFIKTDLDGRDGDIVLFLRNRTDAVDRTEGNAHLAASAIVLIDNGNHFGLFLFLGNLRGKGRNGFVMVVGGQSNLPLNPKQDYFPNTVSENALTRPYPWRVALFSP